MTTNTLNIPISLYLGDGGLTLAFDHPRVTTASTSTSSALTADLTLDERERAIFEATDFVANGTTYRVRATATTAAGARIDWQRLASGCRSPLTEGPEDLRITFDAIPASTSVPSSTTHTTVVIKKGRPFPLTL